MSAEVGKKKGESVHSQMTGFQRMGLGVAVLFYLIAVAWVFFLRPDSTTLDPSVTVLTIAHWQMEDGFRPAIDDAIKQFEEIKAKEGKKVKVNQVAVPNRGYKQWMLTQLVGGKPADILEFTGDYGLQYKYFRSLSSYMGSPNPYNKPPYLKTINEDTLKLQDMAWKDTYFDGMEGSFNDVYADFFTVTLGFFTTRLHVNVDLLEKATGSRALPTDMKEWLDGCEKVKEYGIKVQKPISPIGVRGTDHGTMDRFLTQYYSETNGNLQDNLSRYCDGKVAMADVLKGIREGNSNVDVRREMAAIGVVTDLGRYFVKGFQAVDLEQSKYLFFTGRLAYFPEGTWDTMGLVQNSFEKVEVTVVPPIGTNSKYSEFFTGRVSESGTPTGMKMGIPKSCKNFDLALDFLHFLTSYETDREVMGRCHWGAAVRFVQYEGAEKAFEPRMEGNPAFNMYPYYVGASSQRMAWQKIDDIIKKHAENSSDKGDAGAEFWAWFRTGDMQRQLVKESTQSIIGMNGNMVSREVQRSQVTVGMLRKGVEAREQERLKLRQRIAAESLSEAVAKFYSSVMLIDELKKM